MTDWCDKNKFKKILTIADSNKFNHKNKLRKLKYNDINSLINGIKNNTISEILAKENLNALNELKKSEIKNERFISGQKELLNFFKDLLDAILTENNNNNNNYDNDNDNDDDNDNDNKNEEYCIIKQINGYFKMIDESKSFEDQINLLKKINFL